jgi:hypothetical protein
VGHAVLLRKAHGIFTQRRGGQTSALKRHSKTETTKGNARRT